MWKSVGFQKVSDFKSVGFQKCRIFGFGWKIRSFSFLLLSANFWWYSWLASRCKLHNVDLLNQGLLFFLPCPRRPSASLTVAIKERIRCPSRMPALLCPQTQGTFSSVRIGFLPQKIGLAFLVGFDVSYNHVLFVWMVWMSGCWLKFLQLVALTSIFHLCMITRRDVSSVRLWSLNGNFRCPPRIGEDAWVCALDWQVHCDRSQAGWKLLDSMFGFAFTWNSQWQCNEGNPTPPISREQAFAVRGCSTGGLTSGAPDS